MNVDTLPCIEYWVLRRVLQQPLGQISATSATWTMFMIVVAVYILLLVPVFRRML